MGVCESTEAAGLGGAPCGFEICEPGAWDSSRYKDKPALLLELFEVLQQAGGAPQRGAAVRPQRRPCAGRAARARACLPRPWAEDSPLRRSGFLIYMRASSRVEYVRAVVEQHFAKTGGERPSEDRLELELSWEQWCELPLHVQKSLPELLEIYGPLLRGFRMDILNAIWWRPRPAGLTRAGRENMDENQDGVAEEHEVEQFVRENFGSAEAQQEQRELFGGMMSAPAPDGSPVLDRQRLTEYVAQCSGRALRQVYGKLLEAKGVIQLSDD